MHKHLRLVSTILVTTVVASLLISPVFVPRVVFGSSLEEQLEEIEKELAYIRQLQDNLQDSIASEQQLQGVYQGEIGALRAEVEALQLDVAEMELQIAELEVGIESLEELIASKEAEISETEDFLFKLESETSTRLNEGYRDFRTHRQNRVDIFNVTDPNTYFKDSQYREILQERTNLLMMEVTDLKVQMNRDREDLKEKQVSVRRDREIIAERQNQLERAQADLESKMDGYYSALYTSQSNINNANASLEVYSEEEAKKMAEVERIRQELFNSFGSIPNGQYVLSGTQIGNQGSTGWSTGPHLHFMVKQDGSTRNPCDFLTYQVSSSEGSCGWGSGLEWPIRGSFYYTSRYYSGANGDYRCFYWNGQWSCHTHLAVDFAHTIWNAPIYAAHDGWLYKGVDQYGALYIIICENRDNCNSGRMTGYWHLSAY